MIKVTFLGTGTSQGVPVIACDCDVCQSTDAKDKRLRSSIMISINGQNWVIDTGPDFRQQMLTHHVKHLEAVIFTHEHKDHVAGLDDVRAFNYIQKQPTDIYASERVIQALKREFHYAFAEVKYPGVPQLNLHKIDLEKFAINQIEITPILVYHHLMPVFGYRIGDFAYITDANRIPKEEIEKLKGLKVLVLNALRKEKHISHFTLSEAIEMVNIIQPEVAYLTHISHLMGKHQEVSKELPGNIHLAYDNLILEI